MYWRLAGTFLLALAVYMVAYVLLSDYIVGPRYVRMYIAVYTFKESLAQSSSAALAVPWAHEVEPGVLLACILCGMISSMLAFIVWGCSWSPSRANRRAWLIGIIAFAALLQLPVMNTLVGQFGLGTGLLASLLASSVGAVPGFVLGRASANSLRVP
ncbi:MAG TPA: hypothetical protein VLH79_09765 [Chthonomonadales bacterium]|nr:hypothetical protein [Chthonomonadales bacterium]